MKAYVIILICSVFAFSACKDDEDNTPVPVHNIYIGGMDGGAPVYWKNGERIALEYDTSAGAASYVSGIYVVGEDVYAAGRHKMQAAFWKNGTLYLLPVNGGNYSFANRTNDCFTHWGSKRTLAPIKNPQRNECFAGGVYMGSCAK